MMPQAPWTLRASTWFTRPCSRAQAGARYC
uniref:Uncharacterized protein n=1 Tax=Anguilla anguilla TaxID=7936 RepID=A0A0E9XCE4_ANGAN